jgi:threonine synthase
VKSAIAPSRWALVSRMAKFRDAVERATGTRPSLPARVGDLFRREERFVELPGDYATIAAWIAERATPAA